MNLVDYFVVSQIFKKIVNLIPLAPVPQALTISHRMIPSRKPRAPALLVHGMGGSPSWWNPLLPVLERAGLAALALRLPSLEDAGPESWRDEVLAHIGKTPVVLIGHSLGAAVYLLPLV